jgi:CRP-like cAMP-binding protein
MDEPILSMEEREAINSGRWFSSLSPSLRHDILRCAYVKRYKDGMLICARGEPPEEWIACARGAVRVSSTSITGKQITLTYVEPGIWFGDVAILDGDKRTHDAYAHGETTLLCVSKADFKRILAEHVEFSEAILRLNARRVRQLYGLVEDLNTLPLRAPGQQLLHLTRSYGVMSLSDSNEIRIGLHLAQEELAQLLGASRQRVNQELKSMEREEVIRIEPGGLIVRDRVTLLRIADTTTDSPPERLCRLPLSLRCACGRTMPSPRGALARHLWLESRQFTFVSLLPRSARQLSPFTHSLAAPQVRHGGLRLAHHKSNKGLRQHEHFEHFVGTRAVSDQHAFDSMP